MKAYRNAEFYKTKLTEKVIEQIAEALEKGESIEILVSRSGVKLIAKKNRHIVLGK